MESNSQKKRNMAVFWARMDNMVNKIRYNLFLNSGLKLFFYNFYIKPLKIVKNWHIIIHGFELMREG